MAGGAAAEAAAPAAAEAAAAHAPAAAPPLASSPFDAEREAEGVKDTASELELGLAPHPPAGKGDAASPPQAPNMRGGGGGGALRRTWQQVVAIWHSLPTACKALFICSVCNAILMIM